MKVGCQRRSKPNVPYNVRLVRSPTDSRLSGFHPNSALSDSAITSVKCAPGVWEDCGEVPLPLRNRQARYGAGVGEKRSAQRTKSQRFGFSSAERPEP